MMYTITKIIILHSSGYTKIETSDDIMHWQGCGAREPSFTAGGNET